MLNSPSPALAFLSICEWWRVVHEPPRACRPCGRQGAADCPLHQGIAVRPRVLCQLQLVGPPATGQSRRRGPARGGDPPRSGSRSCGGGCTRGGGCFCRGVRGVENIIPEVLRGQPQWASNPPPKKRRWSYVATSRCSSVPKIIREQWGSRKVALGTTLACRVHWVNKAPCMSWPGGWGGGNGGGWCSP